MTDILSQAKSVKEGDRQNDYGNAKENHERIAAMWSAYLGARVKPKDVVAMMIMVKLSRQKVSPDNQDHWIDIAGYSQIGSEC